MLTDDLQRSVKQLRKLDLLESAVHHAEKKAKNDKDFSKLVADFSVAMEKFSYISKEFDFNFSDEILQSVEEAIVQLESIMSAGMVEEEELAAAKQYITKKTIPGLAKEWERFYRQKSSGFSGKLATVGNLASDKEKIIAIKMNIEQGADWTGLLVKDNGTNTRIQLLKNSFDELEQIEDSLDLRGEVKEFVVSVMKGKARVTDLSSTIMEWIKKENLEDKFIVSFKNT